MKSQVSTLSPILKALHKQWVITLAKFLVLFVSCYIVYEHLTSGGLWLKLVDKLSHVDTSNPFFLLALFLLPFNWGIEALRWRDLARKIETVNFIQAVEGVLTGVALGFVTPSFLGDYAGRTLQLQTRARARSAGSLLLNSASQFIVTYFFGCVGLLLFANKSILPEGYVSTSMTITLILTVAAMIWLFFNARILVDVFQKAYPRLFLNRILAIIAEYTEAELARTLCLSAIRYLVFSTQFYLLLLLFKVDLPVLTLFSGVFIVFLAKTLIPSLSLIGDLGLREMSAIMFFKQFGAADEKVVAACLLLWCINLLIPTLAGLLFILKIRFWPSR